MPNETRGVQDVMDIHGDIFVPPRLDGSWAAPRRVLCPPSAFRAFSREILNVIYVIVVT